VLLRKASTGFAERSTGERLGLGGGVLGHGLGALGHGVLGQLAGEDQADGGLDLARRQGSLAVVAGQTASLGGGALEFFIFFRQSRKLVSLSILICLYFTGQY
jgi:hypothetical protein